MSRKIKWVSSVIPSNELESLELSLADFYSNSKHYFSSINFTENNWINNEEKVYLKIVEIAKNSQSICEIGCGGSNILAHYPELKSKYTGLDFSKNQLEANALKYSGATFNCFTHPNQFPVDSLKFDFVYKYRNGLKSKTRIICKSSGDSLFVNWYQTGAGKNKSYHYLGNWLFLKCK